MSFGYGERSSSGGVELFDVFADYYQIHLLDSSSETDMSDLWDEEAMRNGLAVSVGAMIIGTEVNVDVAVSVVCCEKPPEDDGEEFDSIVEGSLLVPSGRLVIMGCTDFLPDANSVDVRPGWIRVRVSRTNLEAAGKAGVGSDESHETMERARIQLWYEPYIEPKIIKRWCARV